MVSCIFTAMLQWGCWTAYKCLFLFFHSQNWDFRTYLRCWKTEAAQKIVNNLPQPICFGLFVVHMDSRKVWPEQPGVDNGWSSNDIKTIQGVWKPELTWSFVSAGQVDPSPAHSHKFLAGPEQCRTDKSCGKHKPTETAHFTPVPVPALPPTWKRVGRGGKKSIKRLKALPWMSPLEPISMWNPWAYTGPCFSSHP